MESPIHSLLLLISWLDIYFILIILNFMVVKNITVHWWIHQHAALLIYLLTYMLAYMQFNY